MINAVCLPKDKVTKPTITCETNTTDSSNTSGLLTCSTGQPGVAYEWLFYGNKQPGPQLRIFLASKLDERMYSCRVSNPLSNDTAVFTAKDCYSGSNLWCNVINPTSLCFLLLYQLMLMTKTELQRLKSGSTFGHLCRWKFHRSGCCPANSLHPPPAGGGVSSCTDLQTTSERYIWGGKKDEALIHTDCS